MHGLVLENGEHGLAAIQQRIARPIEVLPLERVHDLPIRLVRERTYGVARRPAFSDFFRL